MILNIGKYIYSALTAITGLKVFPVIADFNDPTPTTPFAVYQRTGCNPEYTNDGFTGDISHSYAVTIGDNDYSNTVVMAENVANALIGLSFQAKTGIRFCQVKLTDLSEDFIEGIYTQTLNFEINTTQI